MSIDKVNGMKSESSNYIFLPGSLREDLLRMSVDLEPREIVTYLCSQGLSRSEVVVAMVEVLDYLPADAKKLVLAAGNAECLAAEDHVRQMVGELEDGKE